MPVSVTERWTAFLRGRADAQASRASLAAMRHGLLPAGWVYGRGDQRQAEFDEQRRILVSRTRWPGSPPSRLAAVTDFCIRVVNRGIPAPRLSFVVQAHATSGPPAGWLSRCGPAASRRSGAMPGRIPRTRAETLAAPLACM
jgi:hypothetical protein